MRVFSGICETRDEPQSHRIIDSWLRRISPKTGPDVIQSGETPNVVQTRGGAAVSIA